MKKTLLFFCIILLVLSVSCNSSDQATIETHVKTLEKYYIDSNGDLMIQIDNKTSILAIDALPDSQIIEDDHQILLLSDPTDKYQHGILGDKMEASSVTIVELSDEPAVVSKFSVPKDWVIESILPIWRDWDKDGKREILLTLSNSNSGAKLALFDEDGNLLAESQPIGLGNRWRHALDIAAFGENGQRLLVDVQTPHIGGIVSFYSWDQENKLLKTEASLSGYSTHDIGSRDMHMYIVLEDKQSLLILPSQSKTELVALRYISGQVQEEWRIPLGGTLSGNLELISESGSHSIRAIIDYNHEVILDLPE